MSLWLRIIDLIIGLISGKGAAGLSEKSIALSEAVVNRIRQIVILIVVAIGALAIFCVGVSIAVNDLLKNIDLHGQITFSATLMGSSLLIGITLGILFYCLREKTWMTLTGIEREKREERQKSTPAVSPIENAIALLITDFVEERNRQRMPNDQNIKTALTP
jgi:hypothetical protein